MFIKKQSALVASFGFLFPMKVTCLTLKHVKENPKQVEKNEENTMVTWVDNRLKTKKNQLAGEGL